MNKKIIARPVSKPVPTPTKVCLILTQQEIAKIISALDWQEDTEALMAKLGAELARTLIND